MSRSSPRTDRPRDPRGYAPEPEVLEAIRHLKAAGTGSPDDFQPCQPGPVHRIRRHHQVDFLAADRRKRDALVRSSCAAGHMLAEKVETHEDFQEAQRLGYKLFQGYFFSKPWW